MGQRGSDDAQWQEAKDIVHKRDRDRCRLLKLSLSAKDVEILKKRAKSKLLKLDVAHVFPVSGYPAILYEIHNMVLLNRYSHEMLDSFRHPITGASISYEDVYEWWERICGKKQWNKLLSILEHKNLRFLREEVEDVSKVS